MSDHAIKAVPLKQGRDRWGVVVDGEMVIKTDYDVLFSLGIFSKKEISEAELGLVQREVELYEAKKRAFYLLGLRAHGRLELERKLRHKGFSKEASAGAVQQLSDGGYLDDAAFSKELARSLAERGWGQKRIMSELLARGVGREDALLAAEEIEQTSDQRTRALEVLHKKLGDGTVTRENRSRLYAFLARRGFSYDDINSALREAEGGQEGDFPDE